MRNINIPPFEAYGYSRRGNIKISGIYQNKRENEDHKIVDRRRGIFVIADGVGSNAGAKVASKHASILLYDAMCSIAKNVGKSGYDTADILDEMESCAELTDRLISLWGTENMVKGCSTTIDGLMIRGDTVFGIHAGDSGVYKIDTDKDTIKYMTVKGMPTYTKGNIPFFENILATTGILIEYIGKGHQKIRGYTDRLGPSDVILMATDGFTKKVHPEEMIDAFQDNDFYGSAKRLKGLTENPVMIRDVIRNSVRPLKEEKLFNDDTTFIALRRRDRDGVR